MERSSKKTHPFGEVINCPICFDVYEGRILMCSAGHAVCEKCQRNLSDCPICRCKYTGTRNYQLEEMVSKLKEMNLDLKKASPSGDTSVSTNSNNKTVVSKIEANPVSLSSNNDSITATINRDMSLLERVIGLFSGSNSSSDDESSLGDLILNRPLQIKGSNIRCQMINCNAALPICRLYNHLRFHHENFYKEITVPTGDATELFAQVDTEFTIPVRNYRHALKLSKYGLFFLIINVTKGQGGTSFTGWVQGTVSNKQARRFKYNLELTIGTLVAKYSDLCYGYNQKTRYVETSGACLNISTNLNVRSLGVKLSMGFNTGSLGVPRKTETHTDFIPPPPTTANSNRQRGNNRQSGRGHGRKNKR